MSSHFTHDFSRRDLLKFSLSSLLGVSFSGWLPRLARAADGQKTNRACILLWMAGGAAQTDTFDLKPGHKNGGPFLEIDTAVPGIRISEHLPGLAGQMKDMAIVRSMSTSEGDHQRGTQLMMTGYRPGGGGIDNPVIGSIVAKELGRPDNELPNFVSLSPFRFADLSAGFLGPQFAPLTVSGTSDDPAARANLSLDNLLPPAGARPASLENRFNILKFLQDDFSS